MEISQESIIAAYHNLDRTLFLDELKELAGLDSPLPIGYGQTISQPSLVLQMTIDLKLFEGCRVLEVGTGSGYQTALLARFAKAVYTLERIEPLYQSAKIRLADMGLKNVFHRLGDGWLGWTENAPYDRIIVTAAAPKIPPALLEQLGPLGIMIIPIGEEGEVQELVKVTRSEEGGFQESCIEYVRFVPLVKGL